MAQLKQEEEAADRLRQEEEEVSYIPIASPSVVIAAHWSLLRHILLIFMYIRFAKFTE